MPDDPTCFTSKGSDPDITRQMAPGGEQAHVGLAAAPGRIGRYTVVRVLGEGGMGTVYEAEQDQPKRTVALKVIRAGYLSAQLLKRFEHESQILGRLQHPGIAQVYEAGTVQDQSGRPVPFFAMEFIRGVPLTEYATQRNLGTRERLDLIARVCDAVYHAHQKGVIHRDLKPGNILVDESGQPKILDFGVARATDSDVQQTTLQTDIGQLIGTVPYMSPEQVSGDPDDLDTRSDVYALGVIAYELLAGRLPYDLSKRLIHEAVRVIKEEEPTRLSSINRTLRGDIETIVAKALEKDKARRYQSAESLASDIRRYLKDEPIAARPASTWYQFSKFSRRHRALVTGVAMTFLALAAGIVATGFALKRENEQRILAQQNAVKETAARQRAEAINKFVTKFLQSLDPNQQGKQGMTAADAITQALANLDRGDMKEQPETVAGLLRTIAYILNGNGKGAEAEAPAERALKILRELHPGDHPDVALSLHDLANVRDSLGRVSEAEPLYVQAVEMYQRLFRRDHPDVAMSLNDLALVRASLGRAKEAEPLFVQALEMNQRLFPGDDPSIASGLNNLAMVRYSLGRAAEAEPLYMQALEMRYRLFKGDHPSVATSLSNLGSLRQLQGRPAEAEPLLEEALTMQQRLFEGDRQDVAIGLSNLAFVRVSLGRPAEAEPLLVQALEMARRLFKSDHADIALIMKNLARCLADLDRLPEALTRAQEAADMATRILTEGHPLRKECDDTLVEIKKKIEDKAAESAETK